MLGFKVNRITSCSPSPSHSQCQDSKSNVKRFNTGGSGNEEENAQFCLGLGRKSFTEKTENGQERGVLSTQGTDRMCKGTRKLALPSECKWLAQTGIISLLPELCVHQWIIVPM